MQKSIPLGLRKTLKPLAINIKNMTQNFDRKDPDGADEYFLNCVRNGDLNNAMTCFDPEAIYIDKDGNAINGLANIEKLVANLCNMKPDIKVYEHKISPVGNDMMYWLDKWTLTATDLQGNLINMKGASANMMRRNNDGVWLWLVDNPFAAPFFAE